MDKEDVRYTHTHTKWNISLKKDEIMPFAETWMGLGVIKLSKASQKEKDKYFVLSPICRI